VLRRIIEDSYLTDECHADALVCSATIRMVAGDNQDGYLRHRLKA
jgi:hypothetical protein